MESIKLVENDNSLRITIEDKLDCDKSPRATLLEKEQIDGKMDKKYFDMEKEAKNAEKTDSSDEWEDLDEPLSATRQWLDKRHQGLCAFLNNNSSQIRNIVIVLCMLAFAVYFVFALRHNYRDEGALVLSIGTAFFIVRYIYSVLKQRFSHKASKIFKPFNELCRQRSNTINTVVLLCIYIGVAVVVVFDVTWGRGGVYNLVSVAGLFVYVSLVCACSSRPAMIRWRTVLWGFALQILFAFFILKWYYGYYTLKWLGDRITEFLEFASFGCEFVFGTSYTDHLLAMKILPTIIFVSATISVLFHLGVMQWLIVGISGLMESLMGTTAGESFCAASNIFIGMAEAPLAIKPLIPSMTDSELHSVMTSGFATIAGACMAAYIGFKVPANHLLSASVMSAPAALAISKLMRPETKKTKTSSKHVRDFLKKKSENSVMDAAAAGAISAITLVATVGANLVAFISLLAVVNGGLAWFGKRIGMVRNLSFQLVCSYVLWPFALVMGVNVEDCRKVAQLIGVKTFVNEFVAYLELKELLANRVLLESHVMGNGSWSWSGEDVLLHQLNGTSTILTNGVIDDRSATISTYALCGFSNFGSIGITIGVFTSLLPKKRPQLSSLVVTAMLSGNIACLVTACIAGLFYDSSR